LSSAVKKRDRRAKKGKGRDRPGYLVDDTLSDGALQTLFYSGIDNKARWSKQTPYRRKCRHIKKALRRAPFPSVELRG